MSIHSAWEGVNTSAITDAVQDTLNGPVRITLTRNLLGGGALVYIAKEDAHNSRRKPVPVLLGPIMGDKAPVGHSAILRYLADLIDGTVAPQEVRT